MNSWRNKIINAGIAILFLLLIGYSFYNSRVYLAGPQIEIYEPTDGATVIESPLIKIKGTARNIAFIYLNDRLINLNENAIFDEPVMLYSGYNIVKVSAVDKFQRQIEKQIRVVYLGEEQQKPKIIDEDFSEDSDKIMTEIVDAPDFSSSLEEI